MRTMWNTDQERKEVTYQCMKNNKKYGSETSITRKKSLKRLEAVDKDNCCISGE